MSLENLPAGRKLLLVFAALFVVAAAFLAATAGAGRMAAGSGLKVGEALAPLGDAAMEIQLEGALARIRMEEVAAGEPGVGIEDFVAAMEDASSVDLGQFRLWYSQAGTPERRRRGGSPPPIRPPSTPPRPRS